MKRTLIALSMFAAFGAHATYCPDNSPIGDHVGDDCHAPFKNPTQPTTSGSAANAAAGATADASAAALSKSTSQAGVKNSGNSTAEGGDAFASGGKSNATANGGRQRQQQAQQQGQSLSSRNTASGGAGGQVVIEGNQAGSGDSSNFTAWAPVVHGAGAAAVPTAMLAPVVRRCGPRQHLYEVDVIGQIVGPFGGLTEVKLGKRTVVEPWLNEIGEPGDPYRIEDIYETRVEAGYAIHRRIGQRMIGMEIVGYASTLTTSSARSFSLGVYSSGDGAQGGAAGSAGMQQQSQLLNAFDCEVAVRYIREPVELNLTVVAPKPRPAIKPRARRVAPPPCPVTCCAPVAPTCGIKRSIL
jgi:hypothetical protein